MKQNLRKLLLSFRPRPIDVDCSIGAYVVPCTRVPALGEVSGVLPVLLPVPSGHTFRPILYVIYQTT